MKKINKIKIEFTSKTDSTIWYDNIATIFSSIEVATNFYNSMLKQHSPEGQKFRICIYKGNVKDYVYL